MKKIIYTTLALCGLLAGCHTPTKDEKYNDMQPQAIYEQGVKNVKKHNFADAVEDFEALESRYPFGEYADKAQIGAFYAYFLNEDYPATVPAIERFIRMYPRHPNIDYAYYLKGLSHYSDTVGTFGKYLPLKRADRDQRSSLKALTTFNHLVKNYPNSIYTPDAKQRMVFLREMLAENELVAARFYMKKGAYLAAANRASYVVTHFDQSHKLPEALAIMTKAYRALDLPVQAEDAYKTLALSFPDSAYVKELG